MLSGLLVQQRPQERPSVDQCHVAKIVALEVRGIEEEVVDARCARGTVKGFLKTVERGKALFVEHNDFAIQPRGLDSQALDLADEVRHLG